jgi:antitoxin component YwqK of YwqJK toxin-antitoxin module
LLLIVYLITASPFYAQNTTLVYEPDVQIDAAGPVRYLEERVDGDLTKRADFAAPGICVDFMQRRNADGSLQRLIWFYEDDSAPGDYLIEEQKSMHDGTWVTTGLLDYADGELVRARFFTDGELVEERKYEYDAKGVTKEVTTLASQRRSTVLTFRRPEAGTVEAFFRQPDGSDIIVARLRYDENGRLISEERFSKGKLDKRDVYKYNENGKLYDHVQYDGRGIAVRHVMYGYTDNGLPKSVVHLDEKERVVFGMSYAREYDGDSSKTLIKNSAGEVTGAIEYARENGQDLSRTETFIIGDGELKIQYTDFDSNGNWLTKVTSTYTSGTLKSRSVATRMIRYF